MNPLISALAATGWLGLVSLYFWRRRVLQIASQRALTFAAALPGATGARGYGVIPRRRRRDQPERT